ncbi:response regulator receiver protein [Enterobacteriaceae bacterium Kacie_13]|nr:response regulator receiver protein [Enterobacteriaceae bacterium Kacie_13]
MSNRYCIWPETNSFLKLGLEFFIINSRYNITYNDLVFVDFSSHNAKLYSNNEWLAHLTRTGLRLVLIPDMTMIPLAFYWKKNSTKIVSVINPEDTGFEIEKKISIPFSRYSDQCFYRNSLNEIEVKMLDLMFSDKSIKQISEILVISSKKTYEIKRRLQLKMGGKGSLNTIIAR